MSLSVGSVADGYVRAARPMRAGRVCYSTKEPSIEILKKEAFQQAKYLYAYTTADQLFARYTDNTLQPEEMTALIEVFVSIADLGQERIGRDFYAFLKTAIIFASTKQENPPSLDELIAAYTEPADLGDCTAMWNLGDCYIEKGQPGVAFNWFYLCSEQHPDSAEAQHQVGVYYEQGWDGQASDLRKAEQYYRKALVLNNFESAYSIAGLLERQAVQNNGVRNMVIDFYKIARDKGDFADAAYNLGVIYQEGWYRTSAEGVKKFKASFVDLDEAERNFRRAYELEQSDVNTLALAEIINDNQNALTEAREKELDVLVQKLKDAGNNEAIALERKIAERRAPSMPQEPVVDHPSPDPEVDCDLLAVFAQAAETKRHLACLYEKLQAYPDDISLIVEIGVLEEELRG